METIRRRARAQWEREPAGALAADDAPLGSPASFARIEAHRYRAQPWMHSTFRFDDMSGKSLLEVGVGLGTDHLQWARGGARVTGIDIAPRSIELTRARFEQEGLPHDLHVMDADRLAFPDDRFDAVYSFGVLHHVPDPVEALREIRRVLRPGGVCLGAVYSRRSFFVVRMRLQRLLSLEFLRESWAERLARVEHGGSETHPYVRLFTRDQLSHALRSAGFRDIRIMRRHLGVVRLRRLLRAPVEEALGRAMGWYLVYEAQ